MEIKDHFCNVLESVKEFCRRFSALLVALFSSGIYWILKGLNMIVVVDPAIYTDRVIGISGAFVGFQIAAISILLAMPSNRFMDTLRSLPIMKSIYWVMLSSLISFLITMFSGLYGAPVWIVEITFFVGMMELVLSVIYLARIIKFSTQSK